MHALIRIVEFLDEEPTNFVIFGRKYPERANGCYAHLSLRVVELLDQVAADLCVDRRQRS
ncbi:hypothetical protein BE04_11180 [Sorangium cellulosum]|uniref:Uncharacterized protein n=1 Tax=Sorangium cellulosum TaxID=56 RepID=A0A150PVJ8_SORCE|nr:hypothetical protein BE04_11180 [Sorangium cellulosum]